MNTKLRKAIEDRDVYCWVCGLPNGYNFAVHHRKLRKQGGQDEAANLIAVHHKCHNLGTGSIHLAPAWSYERGYLVHSWDEPGDVPILRPDGSWVLLDNERKMTNVRTTHDLDGEPGSRSGDPVPGVW